MTSSREAFGKALVRIGTKKKNLVVLDGDVQNSTYTGTFARTCSQRFIQGYIAEQNLVGMAVGLSRSGKLPVVATFAAFLTRAHDQLRMAQYALTPLVFVGTHAGVSIGQDGASQMGLDDIAMFRGFFGSIVLSPSDAVSAERCTELVMKTKGIAYLRLTRNQAPVLYARSTKFRIGGSQTLMRSQKDRATIVATGVTVHEALKAADELKKKNISVRVIDCYSVKPIDATALKKAAKETKHLIVVEDHVSEGGLADAIRCTLGPLAGLVTSLAVRKIPKSGKPEQLLRHQSIDALSIALQTRRLIR